MSHWGQLILGSFEVLLYHNDTVEDEDEVDESSEETTGVMPPLPAASWFKKTKTLKHSEMHCGKFWKPCYGDDREEESPFFDCRNWKHEQSDVLQRVCSVCQKLGLYQLLPLKAPQYDISSEGEDRPSDNSNDGEWWPDEVDLNTVTIGDMSIDSTFVATDGKRGRFREITVDSSAGESVVNPDAWPKIDLKPSRGAGTGQRYVGLGGGKIDNLGRLTVKVRT